MDANHTPERVCKDCGEKDYSISFMPTSHEKKVMDDEAESFYEAADRAEPTAAEREEVNYRAALLMQVSRQKWEQVVWEGPR